MMKHRSYKEIIDELNKTGAVKLSSQESEEFDSAQPINEGSVFLSYTETTTIGEHSVTRTATASIPQGTCNEASALLVLRECVKGSDSSAQLDQKQ